MRKIKWISLIVSVIMALSVLPAFAEDENWADVLFDNYRAAVDAKNYEEAIGYLLEGAEKGDTRSIMQLGTCYLEGKIVEQDYEKALEYLQTATDAGDRKAPRSIAGMYEKGQGVEQDYAKALEYYTIAANAGDVTSQCYIGRYYEYGISVDQDYAKALEMYETATAERQDGPVAVALMGLGSMYEHGYGVDKDMDAAAQWYSLAVEANQATELDEPKQITAVTNVYGKGQRICGAIIEYNEAVNADTIDIDTYEVANRTITGVYVNDAAEIPEASRNGCFVIITLDVNDDDKYASVPMGGLVNGGNGPGTSNYLKYVYTDIQQVCAFQTTSGKLVLPSGIAYENHAKMDLVADKFVQCVFEDEEAGSSLMYNLFVPEGYDENKEYPLVLFMPDAGANGSDVLMALRQGNGAAVWATDEEQAKHPSFVVAIQFTGQEGPNVNDMIMNLITSIQEEYSIDASRIYTSGQSQGCIKSIALGIEHRDVFAAYLLVAGQGDAEAMRAMENDNIWIIVSEGDKQAFPGMNASVAAWEEDGVVIAKSTWDAKGPAEDMETAAAAQRAEGTNIKYTTFVKGSTWDGNPEQEDPNEHNSTMHAAYDIEAVRDWVFDQVLGEVNP